MHYDPVGKMRITKVENGYSHGYSSKVYPTRLEAINGLVVYISNLPNCEDLDPVHLYEEYTRED